VDYWQWESEVYPKNWHRAYDEGELARKSGLPKVCNLSEKCPDLCWEGDPIGPYLSAWNQGWDGYKIPAEFAQVEEHLSRMKLHRMTPEELQEMLE
jgi:hypothetical protein